MATASEFRLGSMSSCLVGRSSPRLERPRPTPGRSQVRGHSQMMSLGRRVRRRVGQRRCLGIRLQQRSIGLLLRLCRGLTALPSGLSTPETLRCLHQSSTQQASLLMAGRRRVNRVALPTQPKVVPRRPCGLRSGLQAPACRGRSRTRNLARAELSGSRMGRWSGHSRYRTDQGSSALRN